MRITDVRYRTLDFGDRTGVWSNSNLAFGRQTATLVEVHTDEGVTGQALSASRWSFGGREFVEGPLRQRLIGEDPLRTERLWDVMMHGWRKPAYEGEVVAAISGIDIALWDLKGKVAGLPLWRLLGGFRTSVPVYAAGGYYVSDRGLGDLSEEMAAFVAAGFHAVKMKVAGMALAGDVERVRTVRAAIGDDVALMADANYGWRHWWEAVAFLDATRELKLGWMEEPTHPKDLEGAARVRASTSVPVAAGENEQSLSGCRRLLESGAVDILQLDPAVGGGITEWLRVASLARAHHCPMAPHGDPLIGVHLVAAVQNGHMVEVYPELHAFMAPLWSLPPIKDGVVEPPEAPGLGLDLDPEQVDAHEVR